MHGAATRTSSWPGRSLGSWVGALSASASSESGWVTLGLVGWAFANGVQAYWIIPGCLLGYLFNWFVVAGRMNVRARELQALTVPDFLAFNFRERIPLLRIISVVVILVAMLLYVAAQFAAAGKAFSNRVHRPALLHRRADRRGHRAVVHGLRRLPRGVLDRLPPGPAHDRNAGRLPHLPVDRARRLRLRDRTARARRAGRRGLRRPAALYTVPDGPCLRGVPSGKRCAGDQLRLSGPAARAGGASWR